MKMNDNRSLTVLFLLTCISTLSIQCLADGYRNPPPTAEGLAKAGVNSVFVDDASAISYNPANLGFAHKQSLVIGFSFAQAENTYTPLGSPASFESDGDWQVLPNLYYSAPVSDRLVLGMGITTPYGQSVSYNPDEFSSLIGGPEPVPYDASVMLVNFNPSLAFKLADGLFLGAGADIIYSEFELKAVGISPIPPNDPYYPSGEADGWGLGGNLGLIWIPTQKQRVALTYQSRVDIDYEGDFSSPDPSNNGNFGTTLKYPNIVSAGYGIALFDSVQLEAMVEWLQWSVNDSQVIDAGGNLIPVENNWDDTFTVGVGGSWAVWESLVLRAGYSFIQTPIPDETMTPLLVDSDRHVIGLGLGYTFGMHTIDLAYSYSMFDERTRAFDGDPSEPSGTYDVDSNLAGITYSLKF